MYHALLYLCLLALLLVGLIAIVMTLPGIWLMAAAAGVYAWLTHWQFIGPRALELMLLLALIAEVIDSTSSARGAKRAGGGRRGLWGAIIGGILGGIFLSIVPIPIISTLVGVCLGTFVGAIVGELSGGREVGRSTQIALGAVRGRLMGTFIKFGFGCCIFIVALVMAFPFGRHATPTPAAPAPPTTTRISWNPPASDRLLPAAQKEMS